MKEKIVYPGVYHNLPNTTELLNPQNFYDHPFFKFGSSGTICKKPFQNVILYIKQINKEMMKNSKHTSSSETKERIQIHAIIFKKW